jgi:ADP-heptose:LPS heptosyltransferase
MRCAPLARKDDDGSDEVGRLTVMRRHVNTPVRGEVAVRAAGQELAAAQDEGPLPSSLPIRTILICHPNSRLGNTVLLTPLLQVIEQALPHARIDLVTSFPGASQLFARFPGVGTIHALPAHGACQPLAYVGTLLSAAATRYDVVIDPEPQSWTSGVLTRLMRSDRKVDCERESKRRAGYINVPVAGAPTHMGTFPVYLFRRAFLGLHETAARRDLPVLDIRLSAAEREKGASALARPVPPGRLVVAIAGIATGSKLYPVDWWRGLVRRLQAGTPKARIIEIRPPSGEGSFPELPGYSSRNLSEIASVIAATHCFVGADSGLMHLGTAALCPTVGRFLACAASSALHVPDMPRLAARFTLHPGALRPKAISRSLRPLPSTRIPPCGVRTVRRFRSINHAGYRPLRFATFRQLSPSGTAVVSASSSTQRSLVKLAAGRPAFADCAWPNIWLSARGTLRDGSSPRGRRHPWLLQGDEPAGVCSQRSGQCGARCQGRCHG